jgi:hypothetical protein
MLSEQQVIHLCKQRVVYKAPVKKKMVITKKQFVPSETHCYRTIPGDRAFCRVAL